MLSKKLRGLSLMQQQPKKPRKERRQERMMLVLALILMKRKKPNNMVILMQLGRLQELPKQQYKRSRDSREKILMKKSSRAMSTRR